MSKNKNRRRQYTDYNNVQKPVIEETAEEIKMESVELENESVEESHAPVVEKVVDDAPETVDEEITEETVENEVEEELLEERSEDVIDDHKEEMRVTGTALKYSNIRQQPNANAPIIGKLQVGQNAIVTGEVDGYYAIMAEPIGGVTVTGYIRSDLMKI